MPESLTVDAGKLRRVHVRRWEPTDPAKTTLSDTTGYTARLTVSSARPPYRTLLTADEFQLADPEDSLPSTDVALVRIEPGHWLVTLDRSVTSALPPTTVVEVVLISDAEPEDVEPVFKMPLRTTPAHPVRSVAQR